MKQNYLASLSSQFKLLLLLIALGYALAMAGLIIFRSEAAPSTGQAPSLAISLVSEVNTGILGPNEQRWFKLTPTAATISNGQLQQSLTMFFALNGQTEQRQVSLQLFDENQLPYFYDGHSDQMVNFGAGQPVSRDGDPTSGELFWTGWLLDGQEYYIQLRNDNPAPLDYWLLTDDVVSYPLADVDVTEVAEVVEVIDAVAPGLAPQTALPLEMGQNRGRLDSGQERWFTFSLSNQDDDYFEELSLTMFATPNTAHQIDYMTFEVFTADEVQRWSLQGDTSINNVGAGSLVQRDTDPLTGERFWNGWLVDGDLYYLRVSNHAAVEMDYWLYTDDIYNPLLGEN